MAAHLQVDRRQKVCIREWRIAAAGLLPQQPKELKAKPNPNCAPTAKMATHTNASERDSGFAGE